MALNTNAIFTVATFFILWVAFRFAGKLREGESTMLGRVLITVFGLMIVLNIKSNSEPWVAEQSFV